uniref:NADH dehydrogenase subunit 6 n=1 Tax=Paratapes undulatus TaxID=2602928 RepID=H6BHV7_9BIVA|nr:NADH dehydrogenase subunit 6 [Paratapes undulatus]AEH99647.1 NADH dehydrogenase subunit 6 [Paratapes undulatus]
MLEILVMVCCLGSMNIMSRFDHPMYFGFALLILVASMSGVVSMYSGIYGFMLFMCIVSGILVVFAYSVALVPLMLEGNESEILFFQQKKKMKLMGVFSMGWVMSIMSVFLIVGLFFVGNFIDGYSGLSCFQSALYVSNDWGIAMTLFGVLLFLVMVFSVGIAGKYSGALIK